MSDDGASSVVLIAMLGNVFSPRYYASRARDDGRTALDFCAVNVAVHGPRSSRWAMTERGRSQLTRAEDALAIGRTSLRWERDALVADVDERAAPWGTPVRGRVRFEPAVRTSAAVHLDGGGRHGWYPHAPFGRIEVALEEPRVRFSGAGYFDSNEGLEPLEAAFSSWTWSRFATEDAVAIAYDVELRGGARRARGVRIDRAGAPTPLVAGPQLDLPGTRWGLERKVRGEPGASARLVRTLEDGPFYARTVVATSLGGRPVIGMHEAVSLDRFVAPWVRFLLPFRMRVEAA